MGTLHPPQTDTQTARMAIQMEADTVPQRTVMEAAVEVMEEVEVGSVDQGGTRCPTLGLV